MKQIYKRIHFGDHFLRQKESKAVRMANILYQHKSTKMAILKLCPVLNQVARYVFSERSSGGSEVK